MTDDRLPTGLAVDAAVRRATLSGEGAYLVHRGDAESGGLTVKIIDRNKRARVVSRGRDFDNKLVWYDAFDAVWVEEAEADAYLRRALDRDPDLWVVEFERADGANPFEGGIL